MPKLGQIVENYQGAFAKVVKVQEEGGLYTLTAWVRTEEQAAVETIGVIALNAFGLSQVLKGGVELAAEGEDLSKLSLKELQAKAKELGLPTKGKAAELIAAITAKLAEPAMMDHEVTQEDLDSNPDLVAEGVKVGDIIQLPVAE